MAVAGAAVVGAAKATAAGPSVVSQTFNYTGSTSTFTVPAGITSLTVTVQGAEGGRGGPDSAGLPPAGGYQGVVTGTITVTPGSGPDDGCRLRRRQRPGRRGRSSPPYTTGAAVGGSNPLGYNGGNGGVAGPQGSSGYGARGGAASVVQVGRATSIVAGGSGGSRRKRPVRARPSAALPYSTFSRAYRHHLDRRPDRNHGRTVCNGAAAPGCDGGGSGGGGGGAQGGAQGRSSSARAPRTSGTATAATPVELDGRRSAA